MPSHNDSGWVQSVKSSKRAVYVMRIGASAAGLFALLTAVANIMAILLDRPILGMNGWGLIDAVLFSVVSWRVFRLSLPWAIAGFVMFTIERVMSFVHNPHILSSGTIATVIFFPAYLNAVRGGLYLRKIRTAKPAPAFPNAALPNVSEAQRYAAMTTGSGLSDASHDEYNEFLAYMKQSNRKFYRAGASIQDEFASWLKDRHKHKTAPPAPADRVAG